MIYFFVCFIIEKLSRFLHQRNQYIVNQLGYDHLYHLIRVANVLHSENPDQVVHDLKDEYKLEYGNFHIENVNVSSIPTEMDMSKVYARLIVDTLLFNEDYIQGRMRIYNDAICRVIDDYNNGAYYEPSYVIVRTYRNGEF